MGRAQPSVCEHVSGRRLCPRDGDRGFAERTPSGVRVSHVTRILPSDWPSQAEPCVCLPSSQSGVVNVYSQEACLNSANPKPLKSVMNLRTSVTSLTFNPSSELLAMASRLEDEAVRLVSAGVMEVLTLSQVL